MLNRYLHALLAALALLAAPRLAQAQTTTGSVGIGTTTPNAAAALEIQSTSQGLLLPRLTLAQRQALTASTTAPPVPGLVIYQTDNTPGLYAYDGAAWVRLGADNLGNHTATQNLDLATYQLVGNGGSAGLTVSNTGQVGIGLGTASPTQVLDVNGGILARSNSAISNQGAYLQWNRTGGDGETWLLNQQGGGNANAGIRFGSVTTGNATTEWGRFVNNGYFGLGTTAPAASLDVNGGLVLEETVSSSLTGYNPSFVIPANVSTVRLVPGTTFPYGIITLTSTAPVVGQRLTVYNGTISGATLGGQTIGAGQTGSFVYSNGGWRGGALSDNLGNHTATQALNLQSNALLGTGADLGTAVGVGIRADGGLNLGQNTRGNSIYLGYQAGRVNSASYNQFSGYQSGYSNTTGSYNQFSGNGSGYSNTTGSSNQFSGYQSGYNNTTGSYNLFNGIQSGYNNTGNSNQFSGAGSGFNNSGSYNLFSGIQSGYSNTTGSNNQFSGYQSGYNNTTGSYNLFSGFKSGYYNTAGSTNTALGFNSGPANGSGTITNATALGANATVSTSNTIQFGDANITSLRCQVDLTVTSDARFKYDVRANVPGLAFIERLRPVTYRLDGASLDAFQRTGRVPATLAADSTAALHTGFLAQDVARAAQSLGYRFDGVHLPANARDYYGLSYAQFVVPLVRAVQELSAENTALKARTASVEAEASAAKAQAAQATATLETFEARLRRLEAGGAQAQR